MDEQKFFRCSNPQRSLKSIYVCLAKKCPKTECEFHRKRALHSGDVSGSVVVSGEHNNKVRRKSWLKMK